MESALIRIVLSSIGQFAVVNVIFASTISLNYANDDEKKDEEGEREDHSNKPTSGCNAVLILRHN